MRAVLLNMFLYRCTAAAMVPPSAHSDPLCAPEAMVRCNGQTRFSVLSARVVRFEYSQDGVFEDRMSLFAVNRRLPVPTFTVQNSTREWCNITIYKEGSSSAGIVVSFSKIKNLSAAATAAVCTNQQPNTDVVCYHHPCPRVSKHPGGIANLTVGACCAACDGDSQCGAWISAAPAAQDGGGGTGMCYLLQHGAVKDTAPSSSRTAGVVDSVASTYFADHRLRARTFGTAAGATGWSWSAQDDKGDGGDLNGTLAPTPSTDLQGCCTNPDAQHGVWDPRYPLQPGLLSVGGWALVRDTQPMLDLDGGADADAFPNPAHAGWLSPAARAASSSDAYLFGCGGDYRACLRDYTRVAGRMALPPMAALGVWWSRHWGDESGNKAMVDDVGVMSAANVLEQVVDGYLSRRLPLAVLVMDMEWHAMLTPASGCTAFGGKAQVSAAREG
jgi:hypothetical protein